MKEKELIGILDLKKAKLFDETGTHVGHLQDLAIAAGFSSPEVTGLGAHLHWSDRVGDTELVRPVEEIAVLLPWSQVREFGTDVIHLRGKHPDFPAESARGKILARRDILNKQMVDLQGNRIQRVDDVFIEREGDRLKIAGLEASGALVFASFSLRHFIDSLKARYGIKGDIEIIPWESIERIDEDVVVIGEKYFSED